jgi:glycosyltransferase involved in cell wall biosynthesis
LVSVIIPVYNRTDLLPRAIKSVLTQTYTNLEIVVIDDGSAEDIKGVLDRFDDDRIHYIRHETNRGVAAARNTGIRFAHGEYVAFLDSDDEWFERKIERQLSDLIQRGDDYQISYHAVDSYSDAKSKLVTRHTFKKEGDILQDALGACWIVLIQMLLRKDDIMKIGGFDERFRINEDWEFLISLSRNYRFAYVDEILARIHFHKKKGGRISEEYHRHGQYRKLLYQLHRGLYYENREVHAAFLSELAYYLATSGHKLEAQWFLLKEIALNPFRLDPYLKTVLMYANRFETPEWMRL